MAPDKNVEILPGSQSGIHSGTTNPIKSLLPEKIHQYILETSVYPTEPEPLKEIRQATENHPLAFIASPPDVLQFLSMLIKLINANNILEVGVFTGHSVLASALAVPDHGKILAIDTTREYYELGLPTIQKAGVDHKIDFIESPALPILDHLLKEGNNNGRFDFAFVDADKNNYLNYHKKIIELVKVGGLIAYDNTLWMGSVLEGKYDGPYQDVVSHYRDSVVEFNKAMGIDPRVEICQIPVGDGITMCRRIS